MLIKTSKLEGAALDWAVAQVEGVPCYTDPNSPQKTQFVDDEDCPFGRYIYSPTQNWDQGGPLLDTYVTALNQSDTGWWSHAGDRLGEGASPLIAACRAIVAAKLGDEVEVPDELLSAPL